MEQSREAKEVIFIEIFIQGDFGAQGHQELEAVRSYQYSFSANQQSFLTVMSLLNPLQ